MRTTLLLLALAALAAPALASGTPCYTTSTPLATIPDSTGLAGGDLYVVNDLCQTDASHPCLYSVWVYQESNGIPGLQRGDEVHNDVANCSDGTQADGGGMW